MHAVGHGLLVGTPKLVKLLLLCWGKDLVERKARVLEPAATTNEVVSLLKRGHTEPNRAPANTGNVNDDELCTRQALPEKAVNSRPKAVTNREGPLQPELLPDVSVGDAAVPGSREVPGWLRR